MWHNAPQDLNDIDELEQKEKVINYKSRTTDLAFDASTGDFPFELEEWEINLPDGFLLIYVGKRRSGKSFHIRYLLSLFPQDRYKLVVVMTKTPTVHAYTGIVGPDHVHGDWDPDLATKILEQGGKNVEKNGEGHPDNRILLILDDIIGAGFHDDDVVNKIAVLGRHFDVDVILTTQYPKAIHPTVRTNCDVVVAFEMDTAGQEESVQQDYFNRLGKAAIPMFAHYTEGYSAMVSIKFERNRDLKTRYKWTIAKEVPDFQLGSPKQQRAALQWLNKKSKENKNNKNASSSFSDGIFGGSNNGENFGSQFEGSLSGGVRTLRGNY